ncbi:hypothetical protein BGZ98_007906 [Dissophora globulifera]|nr:hypothetical protein BGZ98_007906 [Dissophora globulifera]
MLYSPITTSSPLQPLTGCKSSAAAFVAKPLSHPASSSQSVPATATTGGQGSRLSTSAAINIPSPPLTPYLSYDDADIDDLEHRGHDEDDDNHGFFSFRYGSKERQQRQKTQRSDSYTSFILRHSTSAPSMLSPLQQRTPNSHPSPMPGFTFTSNLSIDKPKEDQQSLAYFLDKMDRDCWKSVSTIRSTYFFDGIGRGGGFLAIPHLASHGNAKTNVVCRLLEAWLTKKLVEPTISDSIPVLEDNIQSSVQSIESHLKADPRVWAGISQAFIHIRCGHVFMLDTCCDDETIVHLGADEFYQDYPLFVDVEINMRGDSAHQPRTQPTEVLIAFQNVVNRDKTSGAELPYVHLAYITEES